MSFADLMADVDETVFAELSDDPEAIWSRGAVFAVRLPVILDVVEQSTARAGVALIDRADVARISVAGADLVAPGETPRAGDVVTVNGRVFTMHGVPWRDDQVDGRDWLCPVAR